MKFDHSLLILCLVLTFVFSLNIGVSAQQISHPYRSDLTMYVDIDASTWKTRGRIFYDVEGSIRRKLRAAGFTIVPSKQASHRFTLSMRYSEEKGEPYTATKYGTVLRASFVLSRESTKALWELHISEASENSVAGTPPYLDVIEKFDTNPYYFFLGGLLRTFLEHQLDIDDALLVLIRDVALARSVARGNDSSEDYLLDSDHSMDFSQELYLPTAMLRSIQELVRRGDLEAILVLTRLLDYPEEVVRAGASRALTTLNAS